MPDGRNTELFRFEAQRLPEDTFHVLRFRGTEALSSLFSFEIELVSRNLSVDLDELLSGTARLTVRRAGAPDAVFAGRPAAARQSGHFGGFAYYSVTLRPAFWRFTQIVQSAVFLDKTAPEAAEETLTPGPFFSLSHEMRLTRQGYPKREFSMQHEESLYDYAVFRMEQEGIYYYFAPDGDTVIFADSPLSHDAPAGTLVYSPATGLEGEHAGEAVTSFSLCQTPLPARVAVRSYSWKDPNRTIAATAEVSPRGFGDVYLAHEPAESQAEAQRIAQIRAEELRCRSRIFSGAGSSPLIRPGALFDLERHYNGAFNRRYLVTEVDHEGAQESFISLGLGIPLREPSEHLFYRNEFRCIESDVPFRPARKAPRAKITGVMRAFIDGAGSGARAERDSYGRYKLVFPFDLSGRRAGNASCWIRMAQLQVGQDSGFALPVQPGVEALVSFEEGDPDRPYISGVLANGETGSISGPGNQNMLGLRTAGGSQITINDEDKKQGISLLTPSGSGIMMAAGSTDLTMTTTDNSLSTASLAATDVAGILKTNVCGFRSKTTATSDLKSQSVLASITSAAGTACANLFSSLSKTLAASADELEKEAESAREAAAKGDAETEAAEKKKAEDATAEEARLDESAEAFSWGVDVVKLAAQTANLALQEASIAGSAGSYGMELTSGSQTTSSLLQVKATAAQLTALSASLILSGISYAADESAAGVDCDDTFSKVDADTEENKKKYADGKEYQKAVEKSAAVRSAITSPLTSLIPEITSAAVLFTAAAKQEKKLGGISLRAKDENINLCAKRGITQHSDEGILLHAGDMSDATGQLSPDLSGIRRSLALTDPKGPSHWGVGMGTGNSMAQDAIASDKEGLQSQNFNQDHIPGDLEKKNNISLISDLLYSHAENSVTAADNTIALHAGDSFIASAGNKGSVTVIEKDKWTTIVPAVDAANSEAILGVVPPDTKADAVQLKDLSGMSAIQGSVILCIGENSQIHLLNNAATVYVKDGPRLDLLDKEATLTAPDTIRLSVGNNDIVTAKSSQAQICNLTIKSSEISADGKLSLSGGVIKIG